MAGCWHSRIHFGVRFVGGEMMHGRFDLDRWLGRLIVALLVVAVVLLVVALVREVLA